MSDKTPAAPPAAGEGTQGAGGGQWSEPASPTVPRPTYWPFVLALSVCFMLWGVLTSVWMIISGFIGIVVAVTGWIREVQHDPPE